MKTLIRPGCCAAIGCAVLLSAGPACALEAFVDLRNRSYYTSNTTLAETDEIGEWVHTPGIDLSLEQSGTALEIDADYIFERRIYQRDLFEDSNAIRGSAEAVWHALPERLDFTLRNIQTESTIQSRVPNTEANRQSIGYTEVGPTLRLRPHSAGEVQLEYLYTDVNDEETDTDSKRHTGAARYILSLSALRSVVFETTHQDVDFVNPSAPDLKIWTGTAGLVHEAEDLRYTLTGGYELTERTLGRSDVDGAIFDASLEWNITGTRSLEATAYHQIRDSSSLLLTGGGGFGDEIDEDSDLNEVLKETLFDLSFTQRIGPNEFILSGRSIVQNYEDIPRDTDYLGAGLAYVRHVSPSTTLRADVFAGEREYTNDDEAFDEIRTSLEITRQFSRRLSASLSAVYQENTSDELPLNDYEEWIGAITLTYRLVGQPTVTR